MFDRRQMLAGSGLLAASLAMPAWAKGKSGAAKWPKLQAVLEDWVKAKRVPGAVAMVGRGTAPADYLFTGTTDFKTATTMTRDTLFRAYSQTKPVTGMAVMMLIEDGKLKLDQNLADILPAFANPRVLTEPDKSLASRPATSPITIRHLLTHTAGLGYTIITRGPLLEEYKRLGLNPAQVSRKQLPGPLAIPTAPSLTEFADRLATLPLMYDPGKVWSYSVSLDLLGRVIEVVSGMSFDAFLKSRIFDPLGMTNTWFQVPGAAKARMTTNYAMVGKVPLPIDEWDDSIYYDKPAFPFGGAGLVSSPRDWDRFMLMLMGEGAMGKTRIMKTETARLGMSNLLHPDVKMEGFVKGQGFGAGGRITMSANETGESLGTYGWGGAASTIFGIDRVRQIRSSGWIQMMMMNGPQSFPTDVAKAIYGSL